MKIKRFVIALLVAVVVFINVAPAFADAVEPDGFANWTGWGG